MRYRARRARLCDGGVCKGQLRCACGDWMVATVNVYFYFHLVPAMESLTAVR